jgi:hypothetical protein
MKSFLFAFVGLLTFVVVALGDTQDVGRVADDHRRLAFFGSSTPKKPEAGPVEVYEPPKDGQVKANQEADKKTDVKATAATTTKMSNEGEVRILTTPHFLPCYTGESPNPPFLFLLLL